MRTIRLLGRRLLAAATLTVTGCSPDADQRLTDLARHSVELQARQNEHLAQQSQRLAETAQGLVQQDAEARRELVEAQRQLQSGVATERVSLDRQREALETERRQLAAQRARDPLLAEAVRDLGLLLACLAPLLACLCVLRHLGGETADSAALGELLAGELTSDRPLLLPRSYPGDLRLAAPPEDRTAEEDGLPEDPPF